MSSGSQVSFFWMPPSPQACFCGSKLENVMKLLCGSRSMHHTVKRLLKKRRKKKIKTGSVPLTMIMLYFVHN